MRDGNRNKGCVCAGGGQNEDHRIQELYGEDSRLVMVLYTHTHTHTESKMTPIFKEKQAGRKQQ